MYTALQWLQATQVKEALCQGTVAHNVLVSLQSSQLWTAPCISCSGKLLKYSPALRLLNAPEPSCYASCSFVQLHLDVNHKPPASVVEGRS